MPQVNQYLLCISAIVVYAKTLIHGRTILSVYVPESHAAGLEPLPGLTCYMSLILVAFVQCLTLLIFPFLFLIEWYQICHDAFQRTMLGVQYLDLPNVVDKNDSCLSLL